MLRLVIIYFLALHLNGSAQQTLVLGNHSPLSKNLFLESYDTVQRKDLLEYDVVYIFSEAISYIDQQFLDQIDTFLQAGKGIYIGSENWPLQTDARLITQHLFQKEFWENRSEIQSNSTKEECKNLNSEEIQAGQSIVTFPMDVRLNVEVWVDDEPLIMSSKYRGGKIILDGGYSRFYSKGISNSSRALWKEINDFLTGN
jgi:hypothetical protein